MRENAEQRQSVMSRPSATKEDVPDDVVFSEIEQSLLDNGIESTTAAKITRLIIEGRIARVGVVTDYSGTFKQAS